LKRKGRNKRPKTKAKSERGELELESKLPPFSAFLFFSMVFFLKLEKTMMLGERV
jgi:hypothetical protein